MDAENYALKFAVKFDWSASKQKRITQLKEVESSGIVQILREQHS